MPENLLDLLIRHDAFRVCPIMSEQDFVRFCLARGLDVDRRRLRQFERIGVFQPLLRAHRPLITMKIEAVEGGYRELGLLDDGEVWGGQTRTEPATFDPTTRSAAEWRRRGLLWIPGQGVWPHQADIDAEPLQHQGFYSRYQIQALEHVASSLTMTVRLEWATAADGSADRGWSPRLRRDAGRLGHAAANALRKPREEDAVAALLQLLANRFFYKTRDDGRQITVGHFPGWDWGEYARSWSPDPLLKAFDLSEEDTRRGYESLDMRWTAADPIAGWYNLARFVRVAKRESLKGDALRAVTLREMAHVMRLFHREAFGADLRPLGEVAKHIYRRVPDVDPDRDPMRALELTANDFGVNGKPQLVLFVEGQTEQTVLPIIFERLSGAPASRYGIEFASLGGVGNVTGGKENPFSAVWRLVDYLHHHQTLAFVLLDNEGLARNVAEGLPRAASVHSADRRATRPDYVKLWRTSFELDNFSDTEIAAAMSKQAGVPTFNSGDVAACRLAALSRARGRQTLATIDRLFSERTGRPLDKPGLGLLLVEAMFDPSTRRAIANRPIARFLARVAGKAARNHQPVTAEGWLINQRSGHLGTLRPEAKRERSNRLARRRRSRAG